jgi:hypothetical protein
VSFSIKITIEHFDQILKRTEFSSLIAAINQAMADSKVVFPAFVVNNGVPFLARRRRCCHQGVV